VSISVLKKQFSNLKLEDIDLYLLEIIKSKLFYDSETEKIHHHPNRYFNEIEIINHEGIITTLRKKNKFCFNRSFFSF
jgi:hypothetical protein